MKVIFNKNCSKNYMYIEEFENYDYTNDYKINMLINNKFKHSLDFSYDIQNNSPRFKYDITSKQSISSLFLSTPINYKAFTTLLLSLIEIVSILEEYLIDVNSIVLTPEYIYMNPEKYTTYFAVCPGWQQDFYEELTNLLSNLLKNIDHSDDALVLLAYRIFCDVSKPGYNLSCMKESFLSLLSKDSSIQHNTETQNYYYYSDDTSNSNVNNNTTSTTNNCMINNIYDNINDNINKNINNEFSNGKCIDTEYTNKKSLNMKNSNTNKQNVTSNDKKANNKDFSHNLSDNLLKMLISSRLFHNNKPTKHNLYTISKTFYVKIAILSTIVLLLLISAAYTYFSNKTSNQTSFILFVAGIAFLFGSFRYLMELYPSSKIPTFKGNLTINSQINSTKNNQVFNTSKSDKSDKSLSSSILSNLSIENTSSVSNELTIGNSFLHGDLDTGNSSLHSDLTTGNYSVHGDLDTGNSSLHSDLTTGNYSVHNDLAADNFSSNQNNVNMENISNDYGETILLSELSTCNSHRLVYLGTDYLDDVKINTYPFIIGKLNSSVNLFINNPLISRLHASIQLEDSDIYIEDLNSSNGTYLNGKLLEPHEKTILHTGDTLTFSHLNYMFK